MQRPPGSGRPLILSNRSVSEWINRVAQKHHEFTSRERSQDQDERIRQWVEVTFVWCTLRLERPALTEAEVVGAVASANAGQAVTPGVDSEVIALLAGFRLLKDIALGKGSDAALTPELLLQLHGVSGEFRGSSGETRSAVMPEHLRLIVESACRWFSAESFTELNPIEQASIVHLRLLEIKPFKEANQRVAILAASLFSLRSGLPPVMIGPDLARAYGKAVEESRSGNTQPMVELMGAAVERSLGRMIELPV